MTSDQHSITLEELDSLPTHCPAWCAGGPEGHRIGLSETGDAEGASVHLSADLVGMTPDLVNSAAQRLDRPGSGAWQVQLIERPAPGRDMTLLQLELHRFAKDGEHRIGLDLTTAEARTLARQLVYLADLEDLHREDNFEVPRR